MTYQAFVIPVRRKPLAACLASLLGFAAHDACAVVVTTCADSGPGSLRDIVTNHAVSGDTVDLTGLSCANSTISLSTGAIVISQSSLSLLGPGSGSLRIHGSSSGSATAPRDKTVFNHQGTGSLSIQGLEVTGGFGHYDPSSQSVRGGCVYSAHNLVLNDVHVHDCNADAFVNGSPTVVALGGGVFASHNITMTHSVIEENYVGADPSGSINTFGGGVFAFGNLTAKYSTISGNTAGYSTVRGQAGGADAEGSITLQYCTISYNHANVYDGALAAFYGTLTITNSTISHNSAPSYGGVYSTAATTISNSTIAFNQKSAVTGGSAGVTFSPRFGSIVVNLHSTLFAQNTYTVAGVVHENDLATVKTSVGSTVTFPTDAAQGNFNLVRAPDTSVSGKLPADTLTGVCPLLGPLKANGGPTRTHALESRSPAIDAGVNNLGLNYDQRWGPPPPPIAPPPSGYSRHSGPRTDIGAFEVQQEIIVFTSGFEGCP